MAQPKRKRNPSRTTPSKRPKYVNSSDSDPPESQTFWEAECILAEQVVRGIRKYHIKWKGSDPATGKPWPTSWEPEGNANALLVIDWEQRKAVRADAHTVVEGNIRGRAEQREAAQASRRIRSSRVIYSSLECARSSSTTAASTPAHSRASSTGAAARSTRASPRITIATRGDSLERDDYELFSQLASTQEKSQDIDLDSSQLFAARPPSRRQRRQRRRRRLHSLDVVPDSQSSIGEASFIPITQHTDYTTQQSTITNGSYLEEGATEDSVRLSPFYMWVCIC